VNRLKKINKVRNNDYEIWEQVAECEDECLATIAKKKINKRKNIRKNNKCEIEQFKN
ncbi:38989_t:CDS:1, partial [Gigaspora margarita]